MTCIARILAAVAAAWPEPSSTGGRWCVTVRIHTPEGRLFTQTCDFDHKALFDHDDCLLYDHPSEAILSAVMDTAEEISGRAFSSSINHAARHAVQESAK